MRSDSRDGAHKQEKSKVTVCLEVYLNDLRYHIHPDAELGLVLRRTA